MSSFHPAYFITRFYAEIESGCLPRDGAILSAFATTGQVWSPEQNRKADSDLEKLLKSVPDKPIRRLIGYAPGDQHAEPSWLVDLDCQAACELGMRFKQDAIYSIEKGDLVVVNCSDPTHRAWVGRFEQRVDWLEPEPLRQRLERCWPIVLEL